MGSSSEKDLSESYRSSNISGDPEQFGDTRGGRGGG